MAKFVFAAKDGSGDITDPETGDVIEFSSQDSAIKWAQENKVDPEVFDIDEIVTSAEGTSISTVENEGRGAQKIPFAADGGAGSLYTATPMKPQWVGPNPRTSDIIAESRPEGREGPIARQRRTDVIHKAMEEEIARKQELADVEYYYGWARNNPLASVPLSLLAPSTAESIQEGKLPSPVDALIDVPLAASALLTAPFQAVTRAGRVAKGVGIGTGMGLGAEAALAGAHDREIDPRSLITSAATGGVAGGVGGAMSARTRSKLAEIYPDAPVEETKGLLQRAIGKYPQNPELDYVESLLESPSVPYGGNTQQKMARNIERTVPDARGSITGVVHAPEDFLTKARDKVGQRLRIRAMIADITGEDIAQKQKLLDDFAKNITTKTSLTSGVLPTPSALDEAMILYRKDPELGDIVLRELSPHLASARAGTEFVKAIRKYPEGLRGGHLTVPETEKSTESLLKQMQVASKYDEATKAVEKAKPQFQGAYGKAALDAVRNANIRPETYRTLSRVGQSAGARVAPRQETKVTQDDKGNLLYAPEGKRGWDWLWAQAPKAK